MQKKPPTVQHTGDIGIESKSNKNSVVSGIKDGRYIKAENTTKDVILKFATLSYYKFFNVFAEHMDKILIPKVEEAGKFIKQLEKGNTM